MNLIIKTNCYSECIDAIDALCSEWHKERKYVQEFDTNYNPDRDYFNLLNGTGNIISLCIFDSDKLIAAYLGYRTKSMQDTSVVLSQVLLWCIKKEYRTSEVLILLTSELNKLMKTNKIDIYSLCLDDLQKYERTSKYLTEYRDFIKIESYYYKDLRGS